MTRRLTVGLALAAALALVATLVATVSGAATSSTSLHAGDVLNVTCPNPLLLAPQSAKAVAVTCTAPATTTTTAAPTTTTTASTTTTAAPTTTTQPASGGNCTNPLYQSNGVVQWTINTDPSSTSPELWWVNNDAWNGNAGPQSMFVCSESSWYAVSTQPNIGGQVETYPDTEYDVGGRAAGSTKPISAFSSITSTFAEAFPAAGGWDAGYDLWTDNWQHETMIWNQWAGGQGYWPTQAAGSGGVQNINLGGVLYNFFANGSELMFFRQSQVTSGSVDLLAAFQWEVAHGYALATDAPTQLEYGVEIAYTSGTETFPVTGLTMSVA